MADVLKKVLLLALPASGKSEVRRYLANLSPAECTNDFHMGETAQLDDYPYVHLMRRIDDELAALGKSRAFFEAPDRSFQNPMDWGTLIQLLNEDYDDMVARRQFSPASSALHLFERYDAAAKKAGAPVRLGSLDAATRNALAAKLEKEAADLLRDKIAGYPPSLEGRTLVVEFARGGPDKSSYPLPRGFGYLHSLGQLSKALLEDASILYIWVTPEESRRKNHERTDPNDPGSILHHGVPLSVMLNDYGTDDLSWMEERGGKPGVIVVEAHGKKFELPIARFDNRVDKTSFIRKDRKDWKPEEVLAVHQGLKGALDQLAAFWQATAK